MLVHPGYSDLQSSTPCLCIISKQQEMWGTNDIIGSINQSKCQGVKLTGFDALWTDGDSLFWHCISFKVYIWYWTFALPWGAGAEAIWTGQDLCQNIQAGGSCTCMAFICLNLDARGGPWLESYLAHPTKVDSGKYKPEQRNVEVLQELRKKED